MRFGCTCIIPFFNEEKGLSGVLDKITKIKEFQNILLVNDGSSDNSLSIAKKYKEKFENISIVSYKKNKGKSGAIYEGLKKIETSHLFLFDADLKNIKINEIKNIVKHIKENPEIDMGILRRTTSKRYIKLLYRELILSGQRILKTKDLKEIYKKNFKKYQLEIAINDFMQKNKKIVVQFPFSAKNTFKSDKRGFLGGRKKDISMFFDIFKYKGFFFYIKHSLSFRPYNIKKYNKIKKKFK